MGYAIALMKALLTAIYWIGVFFVYYGAVAGDRYPELRSPTFLDTYGKGILVLGGATLLFSVIIYHVDSRKL